MNKNDLFENNLTLFSRHSPNSIDKVRNADLTYLDFCETEKGETNLINHNWKKQPYFYNQKGAFDDLEEWYTNQLFVKAELITVYGIGLGYHYDILKRWLKRNPKHFLVFVEDDPAAWHRFLESEHAETILNDTQVYLMDFTYPGFDEWSQFRKEFDWLIVSSSVRPSRFVVAEAYQENRPTECHLIKIQLEHEINGKNNVAFEYINDPKNLFINYFFNFFRFSEYETQLKDMFGKLSGIPTIVCGAGPSLSTVIGQLNDLREKAIIIAAGTAMNITTRKGVLPHLGASIDPNEIQESRILSSIAYEIPHVLVPRFYYQATPHLHGPLIMYNSYGSTLINLWLGKELGIPTQNLNLGISTSTVTSAFAAMLGSNLVVLLGMDLAYIEGERYALGVTGHAADEPIPPKNPFINTQETISSLNARGETIKTQKLWVNESDFYRRFTREFPHISLINSTEEGLKIDEVPTLPFAEVLKRRLVRSYDIQNWIHAVIETSRKEPIPHSKILGAMMKWRESLLACKKFFSQELPDGDLSPILKEPAFEYSLKPVSRIFDGLAQVELSKLTRFPEKYSEDVKKKIMLESELGRAKFILPFIDQQLEVLDLAIQQNPPPQSFEKKEQPQQTTSIYKYENGILKIQDKELGIDFEELFEPTDNLRSYYPDGKLEREMLYLDGKLHGPSSFYSKDGVLLGRGWFIRDKRNGKSFQYYDDGSIASVQQFINGLPHGLQVYYYRTGQKSTQMNYQNGVLEGEVILYHPNGNLKKRQFFKNGLLHGTEEIWNANGGLIVQAEYQNNLPVGQSRIWHPNGQLAKEVKFYDNPKNFDITVWDDQGKVLQKKVYLPPSPFEGLSKLSEGIQSDLQKLNKTIESLKKSKPS